jgi:hypothetical protein
MTRTELIIQLLKVAIGLAFGAYFVWWSLEVLDRLAPENEGPTLAVGRMVKVHAAPEGSPWMWTLAFGTTRIEPQRTAMPRHARPQWRHLQRAGGARNASGRRSPMLDMKRSDLIALVEKSLGLAVPLSLIARADELIE